MSKTDDLISELTQNAPKVRRLTAPLVRLFCWLAPALALLCGGLLLHGLRPDLLTLGDHPMVLGLTAGLFVIAVFAAYGAFVLNVPGQIQPPWWVLLPPLATLGLMSWLGFMAFSSHDMHLDAGYGCLISIILLAAIPSIIHFFMLRRGAPLHLGIDGGLGLLANVAIAAAAQQLLCPNNAPAHLFVWHFLPVLLGGFVGIAIGRKMLRWHKRK